MVSFYFSVITHTSLMLSSILKCRSESKINRQLEEIDELMFKTFAVVVTANDSRTFIFQFVGYWLVPIILNVISLVSVLSYGVYAEHWIKVLFGRISAKIKCIHILFYLKHLEKRLSALDKILLKLTGPQEIKMAKKLYTELIKLNFIICRWCGLDLVFVVLLSVFVVIINIYWTFLIATGLDPNSSILGITFYSIKL